MNINTVIGQGRNHEDGRALVHRHILSYYFLYDAVSVSYCIASKGKTSDCYSKTNKMHQCIKFILFWNDTLHVSDGLSVHHQQLKTVHAATGICQTDTADCLLASSQQYLFGCCMYSLELLMMDGKTA
jgi:hypothetical protein